MKRKLATILLISISFSNTISASTGAEQAKSLVMVLASVVIIVIFSSKKKK